MSFEFILLFTVTVFVASIIPGPSMLLALTHGMRHGARRTMASALGNVTVTFFQAVISVAGLGTILIASETVFQVIKWAGAAYLIYMGISILLSSDVSFARDMDRPSPDLPAEPLRKLFFQAALVTAGNPKAIVFFTAVFPQFIDPSRGWLAQSCLLTGIGGVIAFACFMIYAVGGEKIVSQFSGASTGKYIRRLISGTFIGAGIGLAASHR